MTVSKEIAEAILSNTKYINELLKWRVQMYGIIDDLASTVESIGNIVIQVDKDIQVLSKRVKE